jgi:CheY-like chemotaxis protein
LTEVVKRVEALCRVTFPREIALSSHIDGHIGHVAIPTADLEQTLLNLLLNARDALEADSARPRREIRLWVDRVVRPADQQDCARVRIEDTGVGMTEDVCKRVFDAFFTTKPPHKGSGLGLANVALHVRDAQGTIECQSKPGVGTTFTLTLPILADAPPAPRDSTTPFDPASGAVVLIVDDEPLVRNVVRHLLQSDGCRVLEASSSHEARSILRRRDLTVDVVILDQSMPHETGVEALPSIRELTDAPVVLFTGMAPVVPAGFAALLEKPATPADLRRVIRQVYLERLRVRQKANARRDTA